MEPCTSWSLGRAGAHACGTWLWSARPPHRQNRQQVVTKNREAIGLVHNVWLCLCFPGVSVARLEPSLALDAKSQSAVLQGVQPKPEEWPGKTLYLHDLACRDRKSK